MRYPEQARFDRSVRDVYDTYRFDDDRPLRLMALQALCLIGHDGTLRQVAQDVQWERDPVVRRTTVNALGQYFGVNDR